MKKPKDSNKKKSMKVVDKMPDNAFSKGEKPKKAFKKKAGEATAPTTKKAKKKTLTESHKIALFISAISQKKYAEANKYLKAVIQDKIKNRINQAVNQPLF